MARSLPPAKKEEGASRGSVYPVCVMWWCPEKRLLAACLPARGLLAWQRALARQRWDRGAQWERGNQSRSVFGEHAEERGESGLGQWELLEILFLRRKNLTSLTIVSNSAICVYQKWYLELNEYLLVLHTVFFLCGFIFPFHGLPVSHTEHCTVHQPN